MELENRTTGAKFIMRYAIMDSNIWNRQNYLNINHTQRMVCEDDIYLNSNIGLAGLVAIVGTLFMT